jgi:predicted transcriptional regulator
MLGRKGFCEILYYIKDHDRVILSDLLPIAGHGTVMDRREELLDYGLISDKKIKEGRRNYIVYDLTPKGEKVLEMLKEIVKILEK